MSKTDLSFSIEEYQLRLKNLRKLMRERHVNLLILDEIEAMVYICGYGVSETLWRACAIPLEGEPFLLVRSLDIAPARERSWFSDIVGFRDWDDPVSVFVGELRRRGFDIDQIALDFHSHSMSLHRFDHLRSLLPETKFVDFERAIWHLRLIKSPAEIAYMRKAAQVADAAMQAAVKAVRVGGVQREVVKAAAMTYLDLGADDALVGPLTSGNDWDSLHGHENTDILQVGAVVHIELVPRVRDYSSRIMRSAIVGKATEEQRRIASLLVELQDRQIAALKPGASAREIDLMMREPLVKQGLRKSYDNVTGYTLGAYPYPTQRISDFLRIFTPAADWTIEEGMTLHMYTSAAGLAFSETVVVNADGPERLTRSDRKLFELTA